jgi:hypothetical protein
MKTPSTAEYIATSNGYVLWVLTEAKTLASASAIPVSTIMPKIMA